MTPPTLDTSMINIPNQPIASPPYIQPSYIPQSIISPPYIPPPNTISLNNLDNSQYTPQSIISPPYIPPPNTTTSNNWENLQYIQPSNILLPNTSSPDTSSPNTPSTINYPSYVSPPYTSSTINYPNFYNPQYIPPQITQNTLSFTNPQLYNLKLDNWNVPTITPNYYPQSIDYTSTPTYNQTPTPTIDYTSTPTYNQTPTPTIDNTTLTYKQTPTPTIDNTSTPYNQTPTPTIDYTSTPTIKPSMMNLIEPDLGHVCFYKDDEYMEFIKCIGVDKIENTDNIFNGNIPKSVKIADNVALILYTGEKYTGEESKVKSGKYKLSNQPIKSIKIIPYIPDSDDFKKDNIIISNQYINFDSPKNKENSIITTKNKIIEDKFENDLVNVLAIKMKNDNEKRAYKISNNII